MGNYNFHKDLAVAKKSEAKAIKILINMFPEKNLKFVEFCTNGDFDIRLRGEDGDILCEVKEDFMCEKTGNVCLEFASRGKDSGIVSTKAEYYLYKIHTPSNGIMYVKHTVRELRRKVDNVEYFRIVNGGDRGSNTMSYLFKLDAFIIGKNVCIYLE